MGRGQGEEGLKHSRQLLCVRQRQRKHMLMAKLLFRTVVACNCMDDCDSLLTLEH